MKVTIIIILLVFIGVINQASNTSKFLVKHNTAPSLQEFDLKQIKITPVPKKLEMQVELLKANIKKYESAKLSHKKVDSVCIK
jgi:hypothetical protein